MYAYVYGEEAYMEKILNTWASEGYRVIHFEMVKPRWWALMERKDK